MGRIGADIGVPRLKIEGLVMKVVEARFFPTYLPTRLSNKTLKYNVSNNRGSENPDQFVK